MLDCLERIDSSKKLLTILHFSYIWTPIRTKLLEQQEKRRLQRSLSVTVTIDLAGKRDDELYSSLVPPLPTAAKLYTLISSFSHAAILLQTVLALVFGGSAGYNMCACYMARVPMPAEWISPDRMAWVAAATSGCHLLWRYTFLVIENKFDLDLIPFLLSDEQILRKRIDQCSRRNPFVVKRSPSSFDELLSVRLSQLDDHHQPFLLRPNRTLEARASMLRRLHCCFKTGALFVLISGLLIVPQGLYMVLLNQESIYSGCEIIALDAAYWTRVIASSLLSIFLYLDTACAITMPSSLALLVTSDMMTYWLDLETRMGRLRSMIAIFRAARASTDQRARMGAQIASASHELQTSLVDFFIRLRRVDQYISIILPAVVCIWWVGNAVMTLTKDMVFSGSESIFLRSLQIMSITLLGLLSHWVLRLKQRTRPAYSVICSLIALHPTVHRKGWSAVLQFYTGSMYAYTVLHARIYTQLLCVKLVSYTFTFMLFVDKIKSGLQPSCVC